MIKIQDKLVSDELRTVHFVCDLAACKGACCVEGDAGAPLDPSEKKILEDIYPEVFPYLPPVSRRAIREQGPWTEDIPGMPETPLINDKECAYVVFEEGTAMCAIEMAHRDGKIDWPKPISCHLYPVRLSKLGNVDVEAVNYETWDICEAACTLGKSVKMPLYKFLRQPLTRKFGAEFYAELSAVMEALDGRDA
ncbi:MAG: DUF3109 family protein [Bacteroidota bacterium]